LGCRKEAMGAAQISFWTNRSLKTRAAHMKLKEKKRKGEKKGRLKSPLT